MKKIILGRKRRQTRRKKSKKNQRGGSDEVGFIVTRCVKKEEQNILYHDCYAAIRKFHPDLKIVFIDDNSDKNVLKEIPMENVEIIQSEFPGSGEYLPYYYLLTRKLFKKAIIIQDSMIVNSRFPYEDVIDYMFLYEFGDDNPQVDPRRDITQLVEQLLQNTKIPNEIISFYKNFKWMGCWGSCMIITCNFLQDVEDKVGIIQWKNIINEREKRKALERAIAVACAYVKPKEGAYSLFGNISLMQVMKDYPMSTYTLKEYLEDKTRIKDKIIKIFNSR